MQTRVWLTEARKVRLAKANWFWHKHKLNIQSANSWTPIPQSNYHVRRILFESASLFGLGSVGQVHYLYLYWGTTKTSYAEFEEKKLKIINSLKHILHQLQYSIKMRWNIKNPVNDKQIKLYN